MSARESEGSFWMKALMLESTADLAGRRHSKHCCLKVYRARCSSSLLLYIKPARTIGLCKGCRTLHVTIVPKKQLVSYQVELKPHFVTVLFSRWASKFAAIESCYSSPSRFHSTKTLTSLSFPYTPQSTWPTKLTRTMPRYDLSPCNTHPNWHPHKRNKITLDP